MLRLNYVDIMFNGYLFIWYYLFMTIYCWTIYLFIYLLLLSFIKLIIIIDFLIYQLY